MPDLFSKPYSFNDKPGQNLKVIFGISLGIFLFILFFQPVKLPTTDFNNMLLIIAGFGAIIFIVMSLVIVIIPFIFPSLFKEGKWNLKRDIILNLIVWALISVAFVFYARYVGQIKITFHSSFILVLLGLAPVALFIVTNQFNILKKKLQYALNLTDKDNIPAETESYSGEIEFLSLNKSEKIKLVFNEIIMLRSADNYVEIFWEKQGEISKKLIRQTLKNIENSLKNYKDIIRCHRTCLVSTNYISKLNVYPQGYKLKMKYIDDEAPVSRQYILKVKEAIKGK